ncbi:LytR/AlgR family response regulator transcription factor [Pedobacter metabolipauper]|uniref:LytTR family two component transcriptional regulator n=1 Tax=Pedobacter metabolipauper TaxID=425513 RepID=A0A4R6T0B2_9SPHI|nr:response regulator [Pedobacter metabolipauper]TDQ10920.1 LytTR family two component transcriptional regulator [Pedobacter metabolipauper]
MKKVTVLIIDDERSAREEVKRLLQAYPEFEVLGEAANADEAKARIELLHPDLLFLDIQMPEKSGFDLLEMLDLIPLVIFTTAFDQYAVKAFEVAAFDYLMKPIRKERFDKAIVQLKAKLMMDVEPQIFVRDRHQYHLIRWADVYLIESMDNYVRLFFDDKKVFLKSSLSQLEEKLDQQQFFRANRAQMINLKFIDSIHQEEHAENAALTITLKSGDVIKLSTRQSVRFRMMNRN